jgi:hypothetical protein
MPRKSDRLIAGEQLPVLPGNTQAITVKRKVTEKEECRENIDIASDANFKIK